MRFEEHCCLSEWSRQSWYRLWAIWGCLKFQDHLYPYLKYYHKKTRSQCDTIGFSECIKSWNSTSVKVSSKMEGQSSQYEQHNVWLTRWMTNWSDDIKDRLKTKWFHQFPLIKILISIISKNGCLDFNCRWKPFQYLNSIKKHLCDKKISLFREIKKYFLCNISIKIDKEKQSNI